MLIIKNNNNGKDLNDFWLESNIINCCDVVKHTQSSNKIMTIFFPIRFRHRLRK